MQTAGGPCATTGGRATLPPSASILSDSSIKIHLDGDNRRPRIRRTVHQPPLMAPGSIGVRFSIGPFRTQAW